MLRATKIFYELYRSFIYRHLDKAEVLKIYRKSVTCKPKTGNFFTGAVKKLQFVIIPAQKGKNGEIKELGEKC